VNFASIGWRQAFQKQMDLYKEDWTKTYGSEKVPEWRF
jgi:hypothetical protein